MPFTVKDFPGRKFDSWSEFTEARRLQAEAEKVLAAPAVAPIVTAPRITAQIVPASPDALERRVIALEAQIQQLLSNTPDSDGVAQKRPEVGTLLRGETKGRTFSLEVLPDGYLCDNGEVYPTLSAAAFGVSGNRRSGWKFWQTADGKSIGEATGRFRSV